MYIKYSPEERYQKYKEINLKYRQAHKEETKACKQKYYQEHKDQLNANSRERYLAHREERLKKQKLYYQTHIKQTAFKLERSLSAKKYNTQLKREVLSHYSENGTPQCLGCGIIDIDILCIDHINGGGYRQGIELGLRSGYSLYRWLRDNRYPGGYQTLCCNCNMKKRIQRNENRR